MAVFDFSSLSPVETELIIDELTERLRDIVWANGRQDITDGINGFPPAMNVNDKISFIYSFNILVNDIVQIVARKRRQ